jgi:hypothetical protein
VGVVAWRDDMRGMAVKQNDINGWSSNGVVLWLVRRQNKDVVEWWREWSRLIWSFYSSGVCESGYPGRVSGSGVNLKLRFRLLLGQKIKKIYVIDSVAIN